MWVTPRYTEPEEKGWVRLLEKGWQLVEKMFHLFHGLSMLYQRLIHAVSRQSAAVIHHIHAWNRKKEMEEEMEKKAEKGKKRVATLQPLGKIKESVKTAAEKFKEFRRARRRKRYENGEVELPVFRIGPNKRGMAALWVLMAVSLSFGIYKNFTAIDKETIHERTVVEARVTDTNELEGFVERFAYIYHAWGYGQDYSERQEALGRYMTDTLAKLNGGMITTDCPTSSDVTDVRVCEVEELDGETFKVRYSVIQKFKETLPEELAAVERKEVPVVTTSGQREEETTEPDVTDGFEGSQSGETAEDRGEITETEQPEDVELQEAEPEVETSYGAAVTVTTENIKNGDGSVTVQTTRESFYVVEVHMDADGSMVIVTNPTACGVPGKSAYTTPEYQSDGSVSAADMAGIEDFLNTFFALYPQAGEKELAYYAAPDVMDVIGTDYIYDGLYSAAYYKEDDAIRAHVLVKYLDQTAKITQLCEYTLTLEHGENWKIVKAE